MAIPPKIGLYLNDDNIVIVESNPHKPQKVISSSITASLASSEDVPVHSDITEEIHIVGTFQRLLRENKIEPGPISVSIPIKDVFLRSFVVPWMPSSELASVVFYEAKKYVPFDLRLLDYVYQAVPFSENKQKRLRIIFYAVRKQTIERYDRILKQTGCKPLVYEASLFSLAKYLISKNLLKTDQKSVVIYTHDDYGQIVFYEKGVCYFVREFSLSVPDVHDPKAVAEVLRAQLIREVRKSLGYYARQFSQDKIKEVLVISKAEDSELIRTLSEEMSVKVRWTEASVTAGLQTIVGMDVMCAYGSSIGKAPSWFSVFNFLLAKSLAKTSDASGKSGFLPGSMSQLLSWEMGDFVHAMQAAAVGALILIGGFIYGQINLQEMKKQNDQLTAQQGDLVSKSKEDLKSMITRNNTKLDKATSIFKDKSRIALMLVDLVKAMPEGSWLQDLSMKYQGRRFYLDIKGYVFAPNEAQFKSVNDFIVHLRSSRSLSALSFKLNTVQKKKLKEQEVISFSITGT